MNTSAPRQSDAANEIALAKIAEVDNDIAECDKVITTAHATIAEAKAKKEGLLAVRNALTPLVTSKEQPPVFPRLTRQKLEINQQMLPGLASGQQRVTAVPGNHDVAPNTGFRDAVRSALRNSEKGLKPSELIKVLTDRGDLARYTGRVRPQDRVYSELHSLKKAKEITRRYGRYVMTSGEATNA